MGIFKYIRYGFCMTSLKLKSYKFNKIRKNEGEAEAFKYAQSVFLEWSEDTLRIIGIDVEIIGKENIPKETCAFVGNHQSVLDIPVLKHALRDRTIGFIAKKEALEYPILGFWIKNTNCVPLDRSNPREAIKVISKGAEYIKEGYNMIIFPEGTRSKDGEVHEFKKGSTKLATKAKAPVVPFSINGTAKCFEDTKRFKEGKVTIVFGEPIYTSEISKEEEKNLSSKLEKIVKENIIRV
ncbi:lysophospholipid acyltransferase family protein [uncultured Clostridium sp.]|uniref:lysophospholipid acyltransferase family protein n=1 Tax=uncultured Clostridium sp. TaxID=59620 RepID=UPI002626E6E7|nr:lysophospholipid acyltransferase family protein [uncultured Clostridium sp.]